MKRACLAKNTNTYEQRQASYIRPLKNNFVRMKSTFIRLAIIVFIVIAPLVGSACEISFEVLDNKKELYQKGDVLVIKVKVVFTHRQCPEGINTTRFSYQGIKVLGATPWVETVKGTFERKFKLQIEDTSKKTLVFGALRTCDKEGGTGSITINVH